MEQKDEVVRKVGSKWQVQSKKGKNLGTFDTKKAADKHLREIEYFKHKGEAMEPTKKYDELISRAIDDNGINTLEKAYAYLHDKSSK